MCQKRKPGEETSAGRGAPRVGCARFIEIHSQEREGSVPVYLKYGEIRGEVKEPAHRSWIELASVQLGSSRIVTPSNRPREYPSLREIIAAKKPDSASTHLFRESLRGEGVLAIIDFVSADGSVFLRVEMSGTLISSYTVSAGGHSPMEAFTLNFTKFEFKYTPGTPPP
jgi:type VI secretion system secreted protein Hcp